jgi:hypothetical protein
LSLFSPAICGIATIKERNFSNYAPFWYKTTGQPSMMAYPSTLLNANEPGRRYRLLICLGLMLVVIGWLYRQQIMNGFQLLAGDRYDGIISTTILEHWYNVFRGRAQWDEVGYFFPHTKVIAQTDAYFLLGVLYTPLRLLGFDQFVAAELVNMLVKAIGFGGMYAMCRRVFSLPFYWSLLAAVLFTLSNSMTSHSSRSQLATVAFTPTMVLLLWQAGRALVANQAARFRTYGSLSGVLFGAWCLTCFYATWFICYFGLVLLLTAAVRGGRAGLVFAKDLLTRHYKSFAVVLAVTLVALLPFLYAFLPKAQETGVRGYGEALQYTVPLANVLQVGHENLYLGKVYNALLLLIKPRYTPQHEYYNTGFAIGLFALFVLSAISLRRRGRAKQDFFLVCVMIATVVTWATTLRVDGHSLWYLPFHLVPGGKALRVVAAYYVFLALPMIVLAMCYLASRNLTRPAIFVISALLVLEELNAPALGLDRKAELARIMVPAAAPKDCRIFYTSAWENQTALAGPADIYAHNVTAMLIAQEINMPTVNGVASFQPRDWDFAKPQAPDYDARVASYASKHGLSGLCKLDLNSKSWEVIPQSKIRARAKDINFLKESTWPGKIAELSGMAAPDAWGAWSNDDVVKIAFTEPLPARFKLRISAHAFANNIGKEFVLQLGADSATPATGKVGGTFVLGPEVEERAILLNNPGKSRVLSIKVPHPVSPLELGATDERRLGIAIHKLQIEPVAAAQE